MTGARRLRVLVVDDHEIVQLGLRLVLTREPWVERCLSARTGDEAMALAEHWEPHVALVDLFIDEEAGAELAPRLQHVSPRTRILLFSGAGRLSPARVRAIGAAGFVSKQRPANEIVDAVRSVGRGQRIATPVRRLPCPTLTAHEQTLLALMATGATNREMGESLAISPHTVKAHASMLYRKLRTRNRTEAVQRALDLGIIG